MTDIPLATILRINAARTIPLARYEEEGNFDRFGYIKDLAENHGADLPAVIEIAEGDHLSYRAASGTASIG